MIKLQQVNKTYTAAGRQITALKTTDLDIQAGEIFGLIGHSGAGKSTLLRLINRLEEPSGGQIWVDGQEVTRLCGAPLRAFRRQIGMIFQHFNLLTCRTVAQNVALPLQLAGESRTAIGERVQSLLQRVGLQEHANSYPAQLSGGQKQRVGIARALATQPKILLCDEATSALDPQTTTQVLELLAQINRELNLTLVLITHEMEVIRKMCDRVAVLDGGVIVEQGAVSEVFLHPQHPTTRRFVQESGGDDWLQRQSVRGNGRLVRLTFLGEHAHSALLAQVSRQTGTDYRLLAGRIDHIKDQPYAQLTLELTGQQVNLALEQLQAQQVRVEALG